MAIPNQSISIEDPGLGLTEPSVNIPLFMGASSTGTNNVIVSFTNLAQVGPALGEGPLVEFVTRQLRVSGGPVLAMKLAATVAGLPGTITQSGGGPLITIAGAAFDSYVGSIRIKLGGILGVGVFDYSLDGGVTFSPEIVIPAGGSFPIPQTNLTLTFPAGTYVLDETYAWPSTEPRNNPADTLAGFAVVQTSSAVYDYITLTTTYASAADAATAQTAFNAELAALFNVFGFKGGMMSVGPDNAATTITAFVGVESTRISRCYGTCTAPSGKPFQGRGSRESTTNLEASVEAGKQLISTDLARVASGALGFALNGSPISVVTAISFDSTTDESLNDAKFTTTRTWTGRTGFYFTLVLMASPAGSDFEAWQHRRIIDEASEIVQREQQLFINRAYRTLPVTISGILVNAIDPRDAVQLETVVNGALSTALLQPTDVEGNPGHIQAFVYKIDQTNDILTTKTILSELKIKPKAYARFIVTTIGYSANLPSDEAPEEEAA